MANRNFNRVQALAKEVKTLFAKVSIGASGDPTLSADDSLGVASIEQDSTGVYVLTLDDQYNSLLHFSVMMLEATAEDLTFQVEAEDVDNAKTIQFQCKSYDGNGDVSETNPSDGSQLLIRIDLKNSSV